MGLWTEKRQANICPSAGQSLAPWKKVHHSRSHQRNSKGGKVQQSLWKAMNAAPELDLAVGAIARLGWWVHLCIRKLCYWKVQGNDKVIYRIQVTIQEWVPSRFAWMFRSSYHTEQSEMNLKLKVIGGGRSNVHLLRVYCCLLHQPNMRWF